MDFDKKILSQEACSNSKNTPVPTERVNNVIPLHPVCLVPRFPFPLTPVPYRTVIGQVRHDDEYGGVFIKQLGMPWPGGSVLAFHVADPDLSLEGVFCIRLSYPHNTLPTGPKLATSYDLSSWCIVNSKAHANAHTYWKKSEK